MNISLTAELEKIVKEKVESGLYNNASEVMREALRFMHTHEQLLNEIKLERLRGKLANAEQELLANRYVSLNKTTVSGFFSELKNRQS